MINLLYAFLGAAGLKLVINLWNFVQCKRHLCEYTRYIENPTWRFVEHRPQIVQLMKGAGITDKFVSDTKHIGYGLIQPYRLSVLDCMDMERDDIFGLMTRNFHEAIGVYRSRMWETVNPLYWVEWIIYLPREVVGYFGVPEESFGVRVAQVIWWFISAVIVLLRLVFEPLVQEVVKKLVS